MAGPAQVIYPKMREREELIEWSDRRSENAPLFSVLNRAIAENDDMFALSLEASEGQMCGRMLLSAVHYLLLGDTNHPLAAYFPTIATSPLPVAGAAGHMKDFCREHHDELVELLRTRTLQTTNPERAPQILFALEEVAKSIGAPFSIIEIGCSAGLLLLFDHYRYEFDDGAHLGADDAEVVLSSFEFVNRKPPVPKAFPTISRRVGLDLNPIDLADPKERQWVLGCTVADQVDKFEALRRAVDYRAGVPLEVITGDAMNTLPPVLDAIEGPVCIFHSWCLYQWPLAAQDALSALLEQKSLGRTIHRVAIEVTPGQSAKIPSVDVTHTVYRGGKSESHLLARVSATDDRRGTMIEWIV